MRDPRPWYREDCELFEREEVVSLSNDAALMLVILRGRQWKRGAIPKTAHGRQGIFGGRFRDVEAVWAELLPLLIETEAGWVCREIEDERARADAFIAEQRRKGRLGGRPKKAEQKPRVSRGLSRTKAERKPIDGDGDGDVRRQTETETDSAATQRAPSPPAPRQRAPAKGPHAEFIAFWEAEFLRATGSPYAFAGARDGANVKAILERAAGDVTVAQERSLRLLSSPDPRFRERGLDLGTLVWAWNQLGSAGRPTPSAEPRGMAGLREFVADEKRRAAEGDTSLDWLRAGKPKTLPPITTNGHHALPGDCK